MLDRNIVARYGSDLERSKRWGRNGSAGFLYFKYRFASFAGDYLKNKELAIMTTRHDDEATRRQVLRAGLAAVGGVVAASAAAQAQEKISQAQVQYQQSPNNGQHCSICVNFQPPASCAIVAGKINPDGWCIAFAPKA
jgi:hypothetical protein